MHRAFMVILYLANIISILLTFLKLCTDKYFNRCIDKNTKG